MSEIKWAPTPGADDLTDARAYLRLVSTVDRRPEFAWPPESVLSIPAKDILRAAGLPVLPRDNAGVKKYLDRIKKGTVLAPVLLVRGSIDLRLPLTIAEGYHRTCAAWWTAEDTLVRGYVSE